MGNTMMRILVFGMTEMQGGIESFLMNYYKNINRARFHFDFLCNTYNKIAYEDEILSLGGKTFHFTARRDNPIRFYHELKSFFEMHAKEYDAIWVNVCSLANIDYLIMAKKYGIQKRIIHCHNSQNMDSKLRGLLHSLNKRRIDKNATDYWSCSPDASNWFYPEKLMDQVVVINNAIDVNRFCYDEEARNRLREQYNISNKTVIGNVGRLHFQKNQEFALKVFADFQKSNPESVLLLIGDGEDKEKLKKQAVELNIDRKVLFLGVQNNVPEWLSAFDVFLFPSMFEGLSLAALEAQANGLPILASDGVIPADIKMNSNFHFYSLEKPTEYWSEELQKIIKEEHRENKENIQKAFVEKGFEIYSAVEIVEQLLEK